MDVWIVCIDYCLHLFNEGRSERTQKGEYEKMTSYKNSVSGNLADTLDGSNPNVNLY